MNDKIKSLGLGLGATAISIMPGFLPAVRTACTGVCGSCGGGCILGLAAGGLIALARLSARSTENTESTSVTTKHEEMSD